MFLRPLLPFKPTLRATNESMALEVILGNYCSKILPKSDAEQTGRQLYVEDLNLTLLLKSGVTLVGRKTESIWMLITMVNELLKTTLHIFGNIGNVIIKTW